jgi:hypothetical protein
LKKKRALRHAYYLFFSCRFFSKNQQELLQDIPLEEIIVEFKKYSFWLEILNVVQAVQVQLSSGFRDRWKDVYKNLETELTRLDDFLLKANIYIVENTFDLNTNKRHLLLVSTISHRAVYFVHKILGKGFSNSDEKRSKMFLSRK